MSHVITSVILLGDDIGLRTSLVLTVTPYKDTVHIKVEDASIHEDDNPVGHVTFQVQDGTLEVIVQDNEQLEEGQGDDHRIALYHPQPPKAVHAPPLGDEDPTPPYALTFGDEHFTSFYVEFVFDHLESARHVAQLVLRGGRAASPHPTVDVRPFEPVTHAKIVDEQDFEVEVITLRQLEAA